MFKNFHTAKDRSQHDWVEKFLKDSEEIEAPPYLWTRIEAHLREEFAEKRLARRMIPYYDAVSRWMMPAALILTMSLGIWLGKELSTDINKMTNQRETSRQQIQIPELDGGSEETDIELFNTSEILEGKYEGDI